MNTILLIVPPPASDSLVSGTWTGVGRRVPSRMWFSRIAVVVAVSRGSRPAAASAAFDGANTVMGAVDEASVLSSPVASACTVLGPLMCLPRGLCHTKAQYIRLFIGSIPRPHT